MTPNQKAALERLINITDGNSGQCATAADFLLAWWNAQDCGGFNLANLWSVDTAIAADMIEVCRMITDDQRYPDSAGYQAEFVAMAYRWRPAFAWWEAMTDEQQDAWLRRQKRYTMHDAYADWAESERERQRREGQD
jgi:hypothetical protein